MGEGVVPSLRNYLGEIIPNPMPESITDRPTKSHEQIFMFSKQADYYFDQEAAREKYSEHPVTVARNTRADSGAVGAKDLHGSGYGQSGAGGYGPKGPDGRRKTHVQQGEGSIQHRDGERWPSNGRNIRTVWWMAAQPYPDAHFATFPEELPRKCILAGCPEGGVVLDPFVGSGTTLLVARNHQRRGIGIDLNEEYLKLAATRLQQLSLLTNI